MNYEAVLFGKFV